MQTAPDITQLLQILQKQSEEIALLKKQIAELEARLLRYEHPKNSSNSSTPHSQDPFRIKRTENLREKSGKEPDGQKGHPGNRLEFSATPDEIVSVIDTAIKNSQNVWGDLKGELLYLNSYNIHNGKKL
jgi:hypothetical protein